MLSRLRHRDIWRRRRGKLRPLGEVLAYNELRTLPVKKDAPKANQLPRRMAPEGIVLGIQKRPSVAEERGCAETRCGLRLSRGGEAAPTGSGLIPDNPG